MHALLRSLLSFLDNTSAYYSSYFSAASTSYSHSFSTGRRTANSHQKANANSDSYAYIVAQLLPLVVLLGLPALALLAYARSAKLFRRVYMVFGALLGWWGTGATAENGGEKRTEEKGRRRRADGAKRVKAKTNSESVDAGKDELELEEEDSDDSDENLHYPGLVNISGTYCFLNSVLQAMASLSYLQPHLEAVHARAVELDVPSPVVDTLQDTLQTLNTPKSSRSSLRPVPIINALSQPVPGTRGARSKLFSSREHQDAQELFQLLSECVKGEAHDVDAEAQRDRGLGGFASSSSSSSSREDAELSAQGVFDGLTANRRSCVGCGYTEAVMHFAFATWSLALPAAGYGGACDLQECLGEYTRLEVLTDCVCRRCSMCATYVRVKEEAERLQETLAAASTAAGGAGASQYRKKKAREARKVERAVKAAIEEGRIEEDVKGVKMERVVSATSTKQAMIARPPKILVLHLNRSLNFGGPHSSRNPIHVRFPEILDLTPYTTSGQLSTTPSAPISAPPPPHALPRCTTPTQGLYATPRVLYRLSAVVVHKGQHSYGHYLCFRRKPRVKREKEEGDEEKVRGMARPSVPQMSCPYGCDCKLCMTYGPVRDAGVTSRTPRNGKGWLRTSDADVEECGLERVFAEGSGGAFLLFYERVQNAHGVSLAQSASSSMSESRLGGVYQHLYARGTPRSSEETVRPADAVSVSREREGEECASVSSSLNASGGFVRPRVVRRTTAGRRERGRSAESARTGLGTGVGVDVSVYRGAASMPSSLELPKAKEAKDEGEADAALGPEGKMAKMQGTANGSAELPEDAANNADEHTVEEALSESIVKVELPSPPRTPSPPSSPRRALIPIPVPSFPPNLPQSLASNPPQADEQENKLKDPRIDIGPPPQAPRTPSQSPSPSPAVSPSSSRKSAQSRIPRPRNTSSASPSKSTSHGGNSSGNGSGMLPDRTPVGLRA